MGRSSIGLDVGTSCVRAAELDAHDGQFRLRHFGQVPLPVGAVVDGEVRQPDQVVAVIEDLWRGAGLSHRRVSLGLSGPHLSVRRVQIPFVDAAVRRRRLPELAAPHIPGGRAPGQRGRLDRSIIDFVQLDTSVTADGAPVSDGLLVVADRVVVQALVDTVVRAGLTAVDMDAIPFALVRSIGSSDASGLTRDTEVIVDIGASLTTVVAHVGGVPTHARTLLGGGQAATDALVAAGFNPPTAESLKREPSVAPAPGPARGTAVTTRTAPVRAAVAAATDELLAPIPGAIEGMHEPHRRVCRVLLTGGGSLLPGLAQALSVATSLPVRRGTALGSFRPGDSGLSDAHLAFADPMSAAAVGLAVRGEL